MSTMKFKPRRGKASTMTTSEKSSIVLDKGEMFVELSDNSNESKIKIGDGNTTYSNLPYAIGDENVNETVITYTENTNDDASSLIDNISSGNKLYELISRLKQAVNLANSKLSQTKTDMTEGIRKIATCLEDDGYGYTTSSPDGFVQGMKEWYESSLDAGKNAKLKTYDNIGTYEVLKGKTFSASGGIGLVGTMIDNSNKTISDTSPWLYSPANNKKKVSLCFDGYYSGYNDETTVMGPTSISDCLPSASIDPVLAILRYDGVSGMSINKATYSACIDSAAISLWTGGTADMFTPLVRGKYTFTLYDHDAGNSDDSCLYLYFIDEDGNETFVSKSDTLVCDSSYKSVTLHHEITDTNIIDNPGISYAIRLGSPNGDGTESIRVSCTLIISWTPY